MCCSSSLAGVIYLGKAGCISAWMIGAWIGWCDPQGVMDVRPQGWVLMSSRYQAVHMVTYRCNKVRWQGLESDWGCVQASMICEWWVAISIASAIGPDNVFPCERHTYKYQGRPLCTQMAAKVCHKVQVVMHDLQRVNPRVVCHGLWQKSIWGTWADVMMVAWPVLQLTD